MTVDADREQEQRTDKKRRIWRTLDLLHDGKPFLQRRGFDNWRPFGIVVHRICGPDPGLDLHDHPWPFVTIILRGGYTEQTAPIREAPSRAEEAEWNDELPGIPGTCVRGDERSWRRWSVHVMPLHVAHRITVAEPNTWTLMIRGRKQRRWGFYLPTGWVDWGEYDYATRRPGTVESTRPDERI